MQFHKGVRKKLEGILGEDAINSTGMTVSPRVSKLAKTVRYLTTHVELLRRDEYEDNEGRRMHIDAVLESAQEMLEE